MQSIAVSVIRRCLTSVILLYAALFFHLHAHAQGSDPRFRLSTNGPFFQVGYDRVVSIRVMLDPEAADPQVRWTQLSGPPIGIDLAQQSRTTLQFRTPPLSAVAGEPISQPGVVAISAAMAQPIRLQFDVTAGGHTESGTIDVYPAWPTPGVRGVAVAEWAWIAGPPEQTVWRWTVSPKVGEFPITVELDGEDQRFVRVRTLVTDDLVVREEWSGFETILYADQYNAFEPCGRCHEKEAQRSGGTKHTTVFERGLLGALGPNYRDDCISCHVVGARPDVSNGGFDDVAAAMRWAFPASRGAAVASLPEPLLRLSGVTCLSCHGPGRFTPSRFDSGMCSTCHDHPPRYTIAQQFRQSGMSRFSEPVREDSPAVVRPCTQCHSTQGFVRWQKGHSEPDPPFSHEAEPVGCIACHDPHDARKPHQLRVYDEIQTLSGLEIRGAGAGALCMTCHNIAHPMRQALAEGLAPLAPQADVFAGALADFSKAVTNVHGALPGSCVACHTPHTFKAVATCESKGCQGAACHTSGPVCGTELAVMWETSMRKIETRLRLSLTRTFQCHDGTTRDIKGFGTHRDRIVLLDHRGMPLPGCEPTSPYLTLSDMQKRHTNRELNELNQELFLWLALRNDKSRGAHHPEWTRRVLEMLSD